MSRRSGWARSTRPARSSSGRTARRSALTETSSSTTRRPEGRRRRGSSRRLGLDEKRYPARAVLARSTSARTGRRPGERRDRRTFDDVDREDLSAYEERSARPTRSTSRTCSSWSLRLLETPRATHPRALRLRAGRRVPGHERDAVPIPPAARDATTSNLCVVGDDDQSHLPWRGADVRNIRDFQRDYPDAHGRQARAELPLDARILDAAHGVIRANRERERRSSGPTTARASRSSCSRRGDERDEATFVASRSAAHSTTEVIWTNCAEESPSSTG